MMEGNNDIFLPGDDALGYVAGPTHDKYFMTFIARKSPHLLRTWSYQFDIPLSRFDFVRLR